MSTPEPEKTSAAKDRAPKPAPARRGAKVRDSFARLANFVARDVWDLELTGLPLIKRTLVKAARIVLLVTKGFKNDECALHASSLTFMTLLSFIPTLALAISLVRAVSYDDSLRDKTKDFVRSIIVEQTKGKSAPAAATNAVPGDAVAAAATATNAASATAVVILPASGSTVAVASSQGVITLEKLDELIDTGFDTVEGLDFGALGGIGLIFLIWTVIAVLSDVESAFNRVWGVVEQRPLARKFTDYLSVLIICPLLGVAASSLPVVGVLEAKMSAADSRFFLSSMAGVPVIRVGWVLFLLTLAFAFLLKFAPNTKVKAFPSIAGGFVAAIGFAVWLKICLALQIGVAKYSTFFGSFAMVPILLSWVYVSWEILLFGAEVASAVQNVETYKVELGWKDANFRARIYLAAALLREAVSGLATGDGLLDLADFNRRHRIAARLLRSVAYELSVAGVLVETAKDSNCFAVRKDLSRMTLGDLLDLLVDIGVRPEGLGLARLATSKAVRDEFTKAFGEGLSIRIADLPPNVLEASTVKP
ncbi:MAG: YihY/virulence factor BrkB family protein [Lentisphaerae bacterium]|nr:YihY/virulence factor BrkB family protein [Lentisphaerota bacterium]